MRAGLLGWLVGAGSVGLALAAGCGGGGETGSGGSGGSGGATASSSTVSSSVSTVNSTVSSTVVSSSGTGMTGDGNDSFATAESIALDTQVDGDLDPTGDVDFYKFDGKAGQALFILTQAQGSQLAFDPDTINTVITLYDGNMKQIAENNDRVPQGSQDSELFTVLPADGTYYIQVWECQTWATSPKSQCGDVPVDKINTTYSLLALTLDPTAAGNIEDAEMANDASSTTPVTYSPTGNGGYYLSILWGGFTDQSDVDVFEFTVPADIPPTIPAGTSGVVTHYLLPAGTSGDGSTTSMGKVWITDSPDPTLHVAEVDQGNYTGVARLSPHLDLTKTYYLWVQHPNKPAGTNDFYFMLHGTGYSNPLEADEAGNDKPDTAEVLSPDANQKSYYVEGDLVAAPADVDHYKVKVPAGTTQVAFACTAQRSGVGLRGFQAQMLKADGTPIAGTLVGESATKDAYSNYFNVPAGETDLVFKISAMSQDAVVTSSFYRCGVHFQ